jgi:hypothetical protein
MIVRGPRYPMEEFVRRGQEIYARDIRPLLTEDDRGKFIAIDIETGHWEMDANDSVVCERLYHRIPTAQPWLERVGYRAPYGHGGASLLKAEL